MIVTVTGLKGGVGKTTAALALASACRATGRRVLLVNLDPGKTLSLWARTAIELEEDPPLTLALPAAQVTPEILRGLAQGFHCVIVDLPAGDEAVAQAALLASDFAVLPTACSAADIWGLSRALALVSSAKETAVGLRHAVLRTRVDGRRQAHVDLARTLQELDTPMFQTMLPARATFCDAMASGTLVHDLEPNGDAARSASALLHELVGLETRRADQAAAVH